jgi:hypothetical protein
MRWSSLNLGVAGGSRKYFPAIRPFLDLNAQLGQGVSHRADPVAFMVADVSDTLDFDWRISLGRQRGDGEGDVRTIVQIEGEAALQLRESCRA